MISSAQNAEYFLHHTVTSRLAEGININVGEDTLSLAKQFLGEEKLFEGGGRGDYWGRKQKCGKRYFFRGIMKIRAKKRGHVLGL